MIGRVCLAGKLHGVTVRVSERLEAVLVGRWPVTLKVCLMLKSYSVYHHLTDIFKGPVPAPWVGVPVSILGHLFQIQLGSSQRKLTGFC